MLDAFCALTLYSRTTLDTLALPTYAAAISVVILLVQIIVRSGAFRAVCSKYRGLDGACALDNFQQSNADARSAYSSGRIAHAVTPVVFAFNTARLLACAILVALSAFTALSERQGQSTLEALRLADISLSGIYVRFYEHENRYC